MLMLLRRSSTEGAMRLLSQMNNRRDEMMMCSDERLRQLHDILQLRQLRITADIVSRSLLDHYHNHRPRAW